MSRVATHLRLGTARGHVKELAAGLLAGIGLGVAAAALILGHGGGARRVTLSARDHPSRSSSRSLGRATAGVQPNREGPTASSQSPGPTQHGAAASKSTVPLLDAGASASFAQLDASLPGRVELALAPLGSGHSQTLGGDLAAHGWSTTKVPVLAALLNAREADLTPQERSWAESAITESNNESILHLFHDLEGIEGGLVGASRYIQNLFRRSSDEETVVATAPPPTGAVTTFGQTEWKPANAVKFFSALARGCILPPRATSYILSLMQHIEPSESWGVGSAGFTHLAFKGGWGPERSGSYLVRQSGIIDVGSSSAIAVAIVAFPPRGTGSFETGTAMLTAAATWLRGHLRLVPRRQLACTP